MEKEEEIKQRYERLAGELNERTRRLFAANEAMALGWGGIAVVARATGLSRQVIVDGMQELREGQRAGEGRIRRIGGGRTSKSVRKLAKELQHLGHQVSHELVSELLHEMGYRLQALRKTREGGEHPDRDGQFEHLNAQAAAFLAAGEPAVSVDAKTKELVGDFKHPGREWHPQGEAEDVRVYDFPMKDLGRATPYGVYDLGRNAGWVNVGIDHETAAFAVQSIRSWWNQVGEQQYPKAKRLLISADGGGSNGSRVRLWKWELQQLADETGLAITVCHLPPGKSLWNKIEHRLFAWISQNWRGKPLVSYAVILQLLAATTTETGLTVQCQLDTNSYPAGRKVADEEMATLSIQPDAFHGEWNYTISPRDISINNVNP